MKEVKRWIPIALLAMFLLSALSTAYASPQSSEGWVKIKAPAVAKLPNGQMMGVVTYFEVKASPGSGHVFVETWPLTQIDLQASARLATMVACRVLGLNWTDYNFYFIVKSNATIIGGPSAGLTMTIATIAALTGWKINGSVMATGMINPDGTVGAVGGILEKAQAVHEAGAKVFLIPLGQGNVTVYEKVTRRIGPFVEVSWKPKVINVVKYAREHWNLTVIQVEDVYQAIWYFFGKNLSRPKYQGVEISTSFLKSFVPQDLNRTYSLLKKAEKEVNSSNKLLKYFYNYLYGTGSILEDAKEYYMKAKDYYSSELYYPALCSDFLSRIYSTYLIELIGALKSSNLQEYLSKCLSYEYSQLQNASKLVKNLTAENPVSLQGKIAVEYRYFDAYNSLKDAWNYIRAGEYRSALMKLSYAEQRIWSIYFWVQVSSTLVSNGSVNASEVKSLAFQEIQFARLVSAYVTSMFGSQAGSQQYLEDAVKAYYEGDYGAALVYATMSRIQNEIFLETLGLPHSAVESRLKDVQKEAYQEICEAYSHAPPILAMCYFQEGNVSAREGDASKAMFYYKLAGEWANVISSIAPKSSSREIKVIPGKTNISVPAELPKISNGTSGNKTIGEIQKVFPIDVSHVVMIGALVVVIFIGCWMLRSRKRRCSSRIN